MKPLLTPARVRFLRYLAVGVSTFLFDLFLLWLITRFTPIPYYAATFVAFLIAVSGNYFLSRAHVFKGTERHIAHGYAYFIGIALLGATVTSAGVALLVQVAGLYYLVARVAVAGIVGIGNYLFNLHFNFRVAGKHE